MASEPVIRPYQDGDETSILDGWNAIFPDQDDLPRRGRAHWDWLFRQNPVGRTEVVVAVASGRVVGQYASVPQRAVEAGEEVTIGLVVDAFVLPGWRRSGRRPGLIVHLARKLHECWCGSDATLVERGHSLLYGYPFPIWRIAQRYLGSEMVRDMDVLFRELSVPGFVPRPVPGSVRVEEAATPERAGDELWAGVAAEVGFGLVRDSAWLDWRYRRHPAKDYRFFVARDQATGTARGLAVLGRGRYTVPDAAIVCDWVVPAADEAAEDALLAALEQQARAGGAPLLLCVFPQIDPRFGRWQRKGFLVAPPSHFLVMNTFRHDVRWLRDRWFFTLGDSDLV